MTKTLSLLWVLLILIGCISLASAQFLSGVCGTSEDDQRLMEPRLLSNLEAVAAGAVRERGSVQYIPVYFHLAADAEGKGRIPEARVLDQLCALNDAFSALNFRFYLRPHPTHGTLFNYNIRNDNVYDNQTAWTVMQAQRHPNAINIFVVNQAVANNNQPGVTLAYYSPQRDWIVCRKDQINGLKNNPTLPHEVGHFFSLQHTFFGWESRPFDSTFSSWPQAPATSPGGSPTERMNKSNCSTAADKICDTPPDYNFGFGTSECVYNGGAQDPLGVPVVPMANNMMGYFNRCTEYVFTPQQQNAMLADRASSARNYLNNTFTPAVEGINTPSNLLVAPVGGVTVPFYDDVTVEWNAVEGATYYLVEFDIVTSFSSSFAQAFITSSPSLRVKTLLPNRLYHWRVRPFNEYFTCAAARQSNFRTSGTSTVNELPQLRRWQLTPNPLVGAHPLQLVVESAAPFEGTIQIWDASGRTLYISPRILFSVGEQRIDVPAGTITAPGVYTVGLQGDQGRALRRVVVIR